MPQARSVAPAAAHLTYTPEPSVQHALREMAKAKQDSKKDTKKKKQQRDPAKMPRQVQDSLQALPHYIEQQRAEGKRVRVFMLRFLTGPVLRLMNRVMSARRYRGTEGQKLKQSEQMRRHLEQRQAAFKQAQTMIQQSQKAQRKGRPR
jgi:hypothetical protein